MTDCSQSDTDLGYQLMMASRAEIYRVEESMHLRLLRPGWSGGVLPSRTASW